MGSRFYRYEKMGSSGYWTKQDGSSYVTKQAQLFFFDATFLAAQAAITDGTEGRVTYTEDLAPLVSQANMLSSPVQELADSRVPFDVRADLQTAIIELAQDVGILDARGQVLAPTGEIESGVVPFTNQGQLIGLAAEEIADDLAALIKQAAIQAATFDLVPATPTNFVAKRNASLDGYKKTELSCDAVDGASDYEWYRAKGQRSSYSLLATTGTPSYTDSPIDEDIAYSYAVLAKTSDGTRSPKTKSVYTRGKRTHI